MTKLSNSKNIFNIVVIVAALGYFVDIYDLVLFLMVRVDSLIAVGIPADKVKEFGSKLLSMQMYGMLSGGIVWGILGDKRGRLSVLFLTILIYSLANIANGFITNYEQYYWLRFIAGFGLAGELGIGITLVSEVMTKESRGYGTSIVSGFGIAGAVLAYFIAKLGWKEAYWAGGILGLLLLGLRIYVHESSMFDKIKVKEVKRGNFISLFTSRKKFLKYFYCILVGIPVWYVIAIMIGFSKEMAEALNIRGAIDPKTSVAFHYIGASIGSLVTGYLSQKLFSRKKSILIALITLTFFCFGYYSAFGVSHQLFYVIAFALGLAQGYWAVFITIASEHFGTNIRSTVTTTVPNFVRGSVPLMMMLWAWLDKDLGWGILNGAIAVGSLVMILAFFALYKLEETYDKELDYIETE
jgi:MFS family permease